MLIKCDKNGENFKVRINFRIFFIICYLAAQRWSNPAQYMGGSGVSYAAHVAGGFTGLFLGTFILRNYEKESWERITKFIFLGIYIAAFGVCFILACLNINIKTNQNKNN